METAVGTLTCGHSHNLMPLLQDEVNAAMKDVAAQKIEYEELVKALNMEHASTQKANLATFDVKQRAMESKHEEDWEKAQAEYFDVVGSLKIARETADTLKKEIASKNAEYEKARVFLEQRSRPSLAFPKQTTQRGFLLPPLESGISGP